MINNPNGKPTRNQSFTTDIAFCHIQIFLLRSGYLDPPSTTSLRAASTHSNQVAALLHKHATTEFKSLQGFRTSVSNHDPFDEKYKHKMEACLVHFNFDMAAVVRYIGGQHTGAHRNPEAIRDRLNQIGCNPSIVNETYRILKYGAPKRVSAHSSEAITKLSSNTAITQQYPRTLPKQPKP